MGSNISTHHLLGFSPALGKSHSYIGSCFSWDLERGKNDSSGLWVTRESSGSSVWDGGKRSVWWVRRSEVQSSSTIYLVHVVKKVISPLSPPPLSLVNHPQSEEGKEINFRVYSCSKIWNCMETDRNHFLWGPMGLNTSELKSPKKFLLLLYCWLIVIMQDEQRWTNDS